MVFDLYRKTLLRRGFILKSVKRAYVSITSGTKDFKKSPLFNPNKAGLFEGCFL